MFKVECEDHSASFLYLSIIMLFSIDPKSTVVVVMDPHLSQQHVGLHNRYRQNEMFIYVKEMKQEKN